MQLVHPFLGDRLARIVFLIVANKFSYCGFLSFVGGFNSLGIVALHLDIQIAVAGDHGLVGILA